MAQIQQRNLALNISNQIEQKKGPACKLTKYDEFLITLMEMSWISKENIADPFKISRALISQSFRTCLRATAKVLSSMVKVMDLDTVNTLKPKNSNHKNYILLQIPLKYSFRH